eukprot:TRINITY_DN8753_c0_g1_i1.p1 TRINITY_DN8753_c0_g1~~TRINITY_DN8753_c0_g1_i1.p1  ORF type:complete len:68 (-),score=9.76 TRINITY_DN8753_c0_g1_i1:148-351(-)
MESVQRDLKPGVVIFVKTPRMYKNVSPLDFIPALITQKASNCAHKAYIKVEIFKTRIRYITSYSSSF